MCFTPIASLTTAIFEFAVGIYVLSSGKKSLLNKTLAVFLFFLGSYQFTEFFLCLTGNPLWAKLGFISYTFLPALGLIFTLTFLKIKSKKLVIISIPVIYSILALLEENFIIQSSCGTYFVSARYFLFNSGSLFLGKVYLIYYFGLIALSVVLLLINYFTEKNKTKKKIDMLIILATIISLFPALILIVILPYLEIQFSSIYCHFAVLFAICVLIGMRVQKR